MSTQMSVDEAAMHAAIMAVNEALEKDDSAETLTALNNPNTCLVKVEKENIERYQAALVKSKKDKSVKAQVDVKERERERERERGCVCKWRYRCCIYRVHVHVYYTFSELHREHVNVYLANAN